MRSTPPGFRWLITPHVAVLEVHVKEVRLRLHLAKEGASPYGTSEDALGALRASSRPTNTGLEVHVKEGYVSASVRSSEDALRAPMSVMALIAAQVAFVACTAHALGRPLRPMKVTITSVMATTSASGASLPTTTSPLLGHGRHTTSMS